MKVIRRSVFASFGLVLMASGLAIFSTRQIAGGAAAQVTGIAAKRCYRVVEKTCNGCPSNNNAGHHCEQAQTDDDCSNGSFVCNQQGTSCEDDTLAGSCIRTLPPQ